MTEKPLVSVIINCYNGEKYLREAIDSVIAQTYENWELVFWDNQSTDSTREIVESYGDPRILYFYAPEHTPLGEARNMAMKKATGDFIAFLDSDDIWFKEWMGTFVKIFKSEPQTGVIYCNFITSERKKEKYLNEITEDRILSLREVVLHYNIGMSGSTVRRKLIIENDISINNNFSLIEDFDFFLRLACYCNVKYVTMPYMKYRVHPNNLSLKSNWALEMKSFKEMIEADMASYRHLKPFLPAIESRIKACEFNDSMISHHYIKAFLINPRAFIGMFRRGLRKF